MVHINTPKNKAMNTTNNTLKSTSLRCVVGAAAIAAVVGLTASCGTETAHVSPANEVGVSRIYTSDAVQDAAARHAYIKAHSATTQNRVPGKRVPDSLP